MRGYFVVKGLAALLLCAATASVFAQSYPTKPIRIVSPYAAGGSMEHWRPVFDRAGQLLGQPILMEYRPGAGGSTGTDFVAKSPPDGYTLVITTMSAMTINQNIFPKTPYDALRDFTPVIQVAALPNVAVVPASLPVKSVKEFVDYTKANPGNVSYASPGNGTSAHLIAELFKQITGADMQHVPYKGSASAIVDLLAARVSITFDNLPLPLPHIKSGGLRALAVTSKERALVLPDVPTLDETGVHLTVSSWYAIYGPAGMPKDATAKLNAALNVALIEPTIKERLLGQGWILAGGSPEALGALTKSEVGRWAKVAKGAGIRLE